MQSHATRPHTLTLESAPSLQPEAMTSDIWKVRAVKSYPDAHIHLLIGRVVQATIVCLEIECQALSFGRLVNKLTDVRVGDLGVRVIPWSRVEIADLLPPDFDYQRSEVLMSPSGHIEFSDGEHSCDITDARGLLRY